MKVRRFLIAIASYTFLVLLTTGAQTLQWKKDGEYIEWHKGGNLHNVSGLGWQEASQGNRLATASDFVATALADRVNTIEDLYLFANELTACITEATQEAERGRPLVSETAAACVLLME